MTQWIITSSILIGVITVLRFLLRGKISLRLQYALWGLVLLRLLVPVSIGSTGISVMNAVEGTAVDATSRTSAVVGYIGGETPDLSVVEPDPNASPEEQAAQYETNRQAWQTEMDAARAETGTPITVSGILMLIWLSGAAVMTSWLLISNLRFSVRLRRSRRALSVNDYSLPVYVSALIDTPCLFGFFRPSVYVTPAVADNKTVLRHSIEHETTHFRHGDHIWAVLRGVCLAFHWYNPLVWLAAVLSRRDAELACDEATIKRMGENERIDYGRTLIGLTCQKRTALLLTATTMTGSKRGIKERISLIAKKPRMAIYTLMAVLLIAAVAVGCTFTGASDSPYTLTSHLSIDDVTAASIWGYSGERELSEEEIRELVPLINALKRGDFTENKRLVGGTPEYGLSLEVGGTSYHFNECIAAGDLELVGYDDKQWWIDSEELDNFIVALAKSDDPSLSEGDAYTDKSTALALYDSFYQELIAPLGADVRGISYIDLDFNSVPELLVFGPGASASGCCEIFTIENGEVRSFNTRGYVASYAEYAGVVTGTLLAPLSKNASLDSLNANMSFGDDSTAWEASKFLLCQERESGGQCWMICSANGYDSGTWGTWYRFVNREGALDVEELMSYEWVGEWSYKSDGTDRWYIDGAEVSEAEYDSAIERIYSELAERYELIPYYAEDAAVNEGNVAHEGDINRLIIDVLNSDGAYAEAALDTLTSCLINDPVSTLAVIGARAEGIVDWICWSLAEYMDGMALDTGDALSGNGLSESGQYACERIIYYLSNDIAAPKSWRQIYLDFWDNEFPALTEDAEIVAVGLFDTQIDGVPELAVWYESSTDGVLYYTDGLSVYHNLGNIYEGLPPDDSDDVLLAQEGAELDHNAMNAFLNAWRP